MKTTTTTTPSKSTKRMPMPLWTTEEPRLAPDPDRATPIRPPPRRPAGSRLPRSVSWTTSPTSSRRASVDFASRTWLPLDEPHTSSRLCASRFSTLRESRVLAAPHDVRSSRLVAYGYGQQCRHGRPARALGRSRSLGFAGNQAHSGRQDAVGHLVTPRFQGRQEPRSRCRFHPARRGSAQARNSISLPAHRNAAMINEDDDDDDDSMSTRGQGSSAESQTSLHRALRRIDARSVPPGTSSRRASGPPAVSTARASSTHTAAPRAGSQERPRASEGTRAADPSRPAARGQRDDEWEDVDDPSSATAASARPANTRHPTAPPLAAGETMAATTRMVKTRAGSGEEDCARCVCAIAPPTTRLFLLSPFRVPLYF